MDRMTTRAIAAPARWVREMTEPARLLMALKTGAGGK